MKKTIFTLSLICLFFSDIKAQVEYKVITSVESIVPSGLGRSRIISVNETKNYKDYREKYTRTTRKKTIR